VAEPTAPDPGSGDANVAPRLSADTVLGKVLAQWTIVVSVAAAIAFALGTLVLTLRVYVPWGVSPNVVLPSLPRALILQTGIEYAILPAIVITVVLLRPLEWLFLAPDTSGSVDAEVSKATKLRTRPWWLRAVLLVVLSAVPAAGSFLLAHRKHTHHPVTALRQFCTSWIVLIIVLAMIWLLLNKLLSFENLSARWRRWLALSGIVAMIAAILATAGTYIALPIARECGATDQTFNIISETSDTIYGVALKYEDPELTMPIRNSGSLVIIPRDNVAWTNAADHGDALPRCPAGSRSKASTVP
jgi:hypothetical protein